jgi:plastocyanin domain-containing protein
VVILGILMLSNGFALAGIAAPGIPNGSSGQGSTSQIATAVLEDGVQVVNTNLSSRGYEPIQVQAGIPVKWNMVAESSDINGCNNVLIIPEYGIEKQLQPGDNIIEFTPEEEGTIPFSCWMGMIRSQIIVGD